MNQPPEKSLPGSPEKWLKHAQSDLRIAQLGKEDKHVLAEQTCFHAQQAAEKSLKAVLLHNTIDFPLTHDLQELIEIAERGGLALPQEVQNIGLLTPYAVETRYPGFWEEITSAHVDEAIALAELTLQWARDCLKM